jgi:hypothetical protein
MHNYLWSLVDLQRWLDRHRPDAPPDFVAAVLRPFCKQVLKFVFLAGVADRAEASGRGAAALFKVRNKRSRQAHYLLKNYYVPGVQHIWALDFVMDDDLRVYLLEGNAQPSMGKKWQGQAAGGTPRDMHIEAIELVTKVQTEPFPREAPPAAHGGFELVYNEAQEACEGTYEPCDLFSGATQAAIAKAFRHTAPPWPPEGAPFEVVDPTFPAWYGENKSEILAASAVPVLRAD